MRMTIEEAIKKIEELCEYKGYNYTVITDKDVEALHKAIEVLKNKRPTIIEEAIDILYDEGWMQRHDKELSESRWIPVKIRDLTEEEREEYGEDICFMWDCPLPDDGQEVLVSTPYGVSTTFFADEGEDGKYFDGYDHEDILAWMPMPEPYKEADNDK